MPANKTIGDIPLGEKMNLTVAEDIKKMDERARL